MKMVSAFWATTNRGNKNNMKKNIFFTYGHMLGACNIQKNMDRFNTSAKNNTNH